MGRCLDCQVIRHLNSKQQLTGIRQRAQMTTGNAKYGQENELYRNFVLNHCYFIDALHRKEATSNTKT